MRRSLLEHDPEIRCVDMRTLVGIARAIEQEAVRRYDALAQAMDRRAEVATAAALRVLLEEERGHVQAVEHWAAALDEPVPPSARFEWRLPQELSGAWDDVAASALLTPYRAFAIAVDNERRAFSFYAYLAAHAADARVMAEAEKLAAEELRHAALMRHWRRRAYHRERRASQAPPAAVATVEALHGMLTRHEVAITLRHRALARRLRSLGDEESARLLEQLLATPSQPIAQVLLDDVEPDAHDRTHAGSGSGTDASTGTDADADAALASTDPVPLLVAAQKPLEVLSESLETTLRSAQGPLLAETEKAVGNVVTRLARIALHAGHRAQASR